MQRHFSDLRGEQSPTDGATLSLPTPESTEDSGELCWSGGANETEGLGQPGVLVGRERVGRRGPGGSPMLLKKGGCGGRLWPLILLGGGL